MEALLTATWWLSTHCIHVFARLAQICMLSIINNIPASELSRKFIMLLVGYVYSTVLLVGV